MSKVRKWLEVPAWFFVFFLLGFLKLIALVLSIPARIVGLIAKQVGRLLDKLSTVG